MNEGVLKSLSRTLDGTYLHGDNPVTESDVDGAGEYICIACIRCGNKLDLYHRQLPICTADHVPSKGSQKTMRKVAHARRRRKHKDYRPESLKLSTKLLELNPEVYTVWNYRREALQPVLDKGGEEAKQVAEGELQLTEKALHQNPKSYAAWHHRAWVVSKGITSLDHELYLVKKLLDADERNFHGWGYRRFITQLKGVPAEEELEYTEQKINQNFSNYSAWHYRSHLLPAVHSERPTLTLADLLAKDNDEQQPDDGKPRPVPAAALDEEYRLVQQAFFTEPEDQSGWLYHRWLLGNSLALAQAAAGSSRAQGTTGELAGVLDREIGMCKDLLEVEPDSKWPLLTLARLREAQRQMQGDQGLPDDVKDTYKQLIALDPMRQGYYQDALDGKAFVITQSLGTN